MLKFYTELGMKNHTFRSHCDATTQQAPQTLKFFNIMFVDDFLFEKFNFVCDWKISLK